uniref:Interferon alpha n=1 Tax=Coturnix japonica TaxID=93934 RepID=A0A8C2T2E0_COTJA
HPTPPHRHPPSLSPRATRLTLSRPAHRPLHATPPAPCHPRHTPRRPFASSPRPTSAPAPCPLKRHHPWTPATSGKLTKTTHDILQDLFSILSGPSTPPHWIESQRQSLLSHIQRYTQHLEQCLEKNSDTRSRTRRPRNLHLTISKHFSCLRTFLSDNDYSDCAWDLVLLQAREWFRPPHLTRVLRTHDGRNTKAAYDRSG